MSDAGAVTVGAARRASWPRRSTTRDGRVLIAERPPGKHMAGRWEFPAARSSPARAKQQALARELREELGIEVARGTSRC